MYSWGIPASAQIRSTHSISVEEADADALVTDFSLPLVKEGTSGKTQAQHTAEAPKKRGKIGYESAWNKMGPPRHSRRAVPSSRSLDEGGIRYACHIPLGKV
jgi:hypothetical protein